ncbi:MAG TPA: ATP-binding protein [Rhodanobacteraceae bacterium]|nr:ATP-binding protein [Rhodanobacteraceae bacterium]
MTVFPRVHRVAWLLLLLICAGAAAHAATAPVLTLRTAQAVASDWNAATPPETGWVSVKLPDDWSHRWARHDGVVWYRLRWQQTQASQPIGLLLNQVTLADAVYVNGSLVHCDPDLVEPLSRSWIKPQYFVVDAPTLRIGTNTLLVRVSGLANYQPGLGVISVGAPHAVYAQYHTGWLIRYQLRLYNQAFFLAMGVVFLVLWLFRRRDTLYGWFAASTLLIGAWDWNNVAPSTWPFGSTDAFQSWNMVFYVAGTVALAVFLLRFCGKRWPRTEAALWTYTGAIALCAAFAPHLLGVWRFQLAPIDIALYFAVPMAFIGYALRKRQPDMLILALCLALPLLAIAHDVLRFFEVIHDRAYIASITAPFTLVGMSVVLAHRFATAMRQVEDFNYQLRARVDNATARLSETLGREHALALANAQIGARLDLVRDLHDGFGGSLVSAIAALEHGPAGVNPDAHAVNTLKSLRDDLHLVINTTTHAVSGDLMEPLETLRHRWSDRLDAAGIASHWRLADIDHLQFPPGQSLDVLRFIQEALTNALKHSEAGRVHVDVQGTDAALCVEIRDDGCGFDASSHPEGTGLTSLASRARRLDAKFLIDAAPGRGTCLRMDVPLASACE